MAWLYSLLEYAVCVGEDFILYTLLKHKVGITDKKKKWALLNTTLAIPENIQMDMISLCSIVSNLMDNAIEAAKKLPTDKRFCDLSLSVSGNMLCIRVFNASDGIYRYEKGEIATTKEDTKNHGIGISRVKKTAEKLGGVFRIEPQKTTFEAVILLPLEE